MIYVMKITAFGWLFFLQKLPADNVNCCSNFYRTMLSQDVRPSVYLSDCFVNSCAYHAPLL